jgi:RHS repeat-associated protein
VGQLPIHWIYLLAQEVSRRNLRSKFYSVNGMRLAMRQASTLYYLLPDLLGSPTVALSSSGSFQSVQLFNPYGTSRYSSGSMPTDYNFTGQRLDSETGLIYDNFRYYDPLSGRFTRADTVETSASGMDGYGYVGDNPEGRTDPSGHCWPLCTMIIGAVIGAAVHVAVTTVTSVAQGKPPTAGQLLQAAAVGAVTGAITGLVGPEAGPVARIAVGAVASGAGQMVGNALSGKLLMDGVVQAAIAGAITGGLVEGASALLKGAASEAADALEEGSCSFTPDTKVTTEHGEQAIGKLRIGEKVLAYNPKTHKMELQPILHVWIDHDNDLVDLALTTVSRQAHSHVLTTSSEVIHTNTKHPFFTQEKGFLSVGQIKLGMHVLRADGQWGLVTGWKIVPGSMTMYNLEVAQDHTFTVGTGAWVVHNMCASSNIYRLLSFLGDKTDETRINENLPPRMVRGGSSTPNVAAALVSYITGNGGVNEWETFVSNPVEHSEQQAVNWGASRLTSLVNQYGSGGDASLTVVTVLALRSRFSRLCWKHK